MTHILLRLSLLRFALFLAMAAGFASAPSWADPQPVSVAAAGTSPAVFDGEHTYQAPGGEIHFTVAGDIKSQPDMQAGLCWKPSASEPVAFE